MGNLKPSFILWITRFLIGLVFVINIQCAFIFLTYPKLFAISFELVGIPGEVAVQGFGILFIMWNIPYIIAIIHPVKFRISLFEAIFMQTIGVFGESFIYAHLPLNYPLLSSSILRFILFDAGGLVSLILAGFLSTAKSIQTSDY